MNKFIPFLCLLFACSSQQVLSPPVQKPKPTCQHPAPKNLFYATCSNGKTSDVDCGYLSYDLMTEEAFEAYQLENCTQSSPECTQSYQIFIMKKLIERYYLAPKHMVATVCSDLPGMCDNFMLLEGVLRSYHNDIAIMRSKATCYQK